MTLKPKKAAPPVAKTAEGATKQPFVIEGAEVAEIRDGVARVTWDDGQVCEVGFDHDLSKAAEDAMAWKRARS